MILTSNGTSKYWCFFTSKNPHHSSRLRCGRIISKFMVESWENVVLLWVVQWPHKPQDPGFGHLRWCVWLSERTGQWDKNRHLFGAGTKKKLKEKGRLFFWGRRGRRTFFIFVGTWICFFCCVCVCVCFFKALYHGSHHYFFTTNTWEKLFWNWLSIEDGGANP